LAPPELAAQQPAAPAAAARKVVVEVQGLEVRVVDLDPAIEFFKLFGFALVDRKSPQIATVRNGGAVIDLIAVPKRLEIDDSKVSNTHINLRVESLAAAIEELKARPGYRFVGELRRKSPVGDYSIVKDPSGNIFHLMEPSEKGAEGIRRGIFNVGIALPDMAAGRKFYCELLGFEIFSEDYFPPDLPLKRKGALPLVLHQTVTTAAALGYPDTADSIVVLATPNLREALAALRADGVRVLQAEPVESPLGRYSTFLDPFGVVLELRQTAAAAPR
jgi:predicted enzyme related to lactoylglutathione lyase